MKTYSSATNKNNPSYILISVAVVQSEIFWICSVLYHVFQSGLATQQSHVSRKSTGKTTTTMGRLRSRSTPTSPATLNNSALHINNQEPRRSSLPMPVTTTAIITRNSNNIRQRPSALDERQGITCPPVWWQKTRVKLGRPPVHEDAKILDSNSSQQTIEDSTNTLVSQNDTIIVNSSLLPSTSSTLYCLSPLSSTHDSSCFTSPSSMHTISNHQDLELSRQASETSVPSNISSEHHQRHRVKKFVGKLNNALKSIPHHHHHHRHYRNNSTDSKKGF